MVVERLAVAVQRGGLEVLEEGCCFARDRGGARYELLIARADFVALDRHAHDHLPALLDTARRAAQAARRCRRRRRPGVLRLSDRVTGETLLCWAA